MHPNPAFRTASAERNLAFARARGFGVLTAAGPDGPLAAHVPFVLSDDGGRLEAHLVRSNPLWRALAEPLPALMIVSGPDGYVSPDWYGIDDQVPTWNYVAVHLRGSLARLPDAALRQHLDRLSAANEGRLLPKPPWRTGKMPADLLARMMRMIAPVALTIDAVDGTWKLSQNKADPVRLAAAEALDKAGPGQEIASLAALMRQPPDA